MRTILNQINTNHRKNWYKSLLEIYLMIVTTVAVIFSFAIFWAILAKKLLPAEQRLFDKAKLKYTDGDNT